MTKIALVDDHILLRDALADVINKFDHCQVVLRARNGVELLDALAAGCQPDLVLLDVDMPQMDGYDTARALKDRYPQIFILVLTMYDSELAMIRLLQLGVRGILIKDISPAELRISIETTMRTGYYYSHTSAGKLVQLLKQDDAKNPRVNQLLLSDSEILFLRLCSTEKTYKEIARAMKTTPRTIENYRENLFVKLNVKSRVGLVLFALQNGVLTGERKDPD